MQILDLSASTRDTNSTSKPIPIDGVFGEFLASQVTSSTPPPPASKNQSQTLVTQKGRSLGSSLGVKDGSSREKPAFDTAPNPLDLDKSLQMEHLDCPRIRLEADAWHAFLKIFTAC